MQNVNNHSRLLVGWHGVTAIALLILVIGSIVNLCNAPAQTHIVSALIVLIALILCFIFWFARVFALKAQDRAIRSEENLRHFALAGKLLDSRLGINQVIALRFAADDEFVALAQKAADEQLGIKAIKQAIINWKADTYRV
ncbi:MAG: hypothetical protein H7101_08290 [Deinococcales bacterium]|nr:hypothetical protein [Chitinophagaceae bacterium]